MARRRIGIFQGCQPRPGLSCCGNTLTTPVRGSCRGFGSGGQGSVPNRPAPLAADRRRLVRTTRSMISCGASRAIPEGGRPGGRRATTAGDHSAPASVSSSTNSGMNAYGFSSPTGQQWWQRTRRHQRWTTRHPIRFQECADRRPLLQQSCSDLRFPGPSRDHPMHRTRCPGVSGNRFHGCLGPRCRLPQLRPQTHPIGYS